MAHDLVIRGGTLYDGTGKPGALADLAIDGDRITQVGGAVGAGEREIDATGLAVAPGFIDPHTHYDAQICWDRDLTPSCWQGITTVIMGNCGFTLAPCRPEDRDGVMRMLTRVEGMSLEALRTGIDWTWESFSEYLGMLDANPMSLNVGMLAGHSAVRTFVMGAAATEREATPEEVEAMRAEVREAMEAGALGFSTSMAPTHVGGDGKPVPSRLASDEEVIELTSVLSEFGRGAFGIVTRDLTDVDVPIAVAKRTGRPVTLLGIVGDEENAKLERATAEGHCILPQVTCRPTSMEFRLNEMSFFDQLPSWQETTKVKGKALSALLRDPSFRDRFREDLEGEFEGYRLFQGDWDGLSILAAEDSELRKHVGSNIEAIAAARGQDPLDVFLDIALEDDLHMQFGYTLAGDDTRGPGLCDDNHMIGLSDAGAHLTLLADHAYTTYFLGRWIRERKLMPLEDAIRKLTSVPAAFYGVPERGELRTGYFADVVLFDPERIINHEPELVNDLPGGNARLLTRADGIEAVIVNGGITVERGELTGVRGGQVIRGA
ncbi:MAG: amidohydrolase family protein [bacterium]|nr:amidohydrolase family protein [bacterium]